MNRFLVTLAVGLVFAVGTAAASDCWGCNKGCNTGCGTSCCWTGCGLKSYCNTNCHPCGQKSSFWARVNSAAATTDCDEARWQKFWHDYYRALSAYYKRLDRLDWVIYYKFHGTQTGGGHCAPMGPAGCGHYQARPQYAPVFVAPQMTWGVSGGTCGQQGCTPVGGWAANWPGR